MVDKCNFLYSKYISAAVVYYNISHIIQPANKPETFWLYNENDFGYKTQSSHIPRVATN